MLKVLNGCDYIMLDPVHLHKEVVKRFKTLDKLIPYIDMPTQHGSDKILKDMKRGVEFIRYQKKN